MEINKQVELASSRRSPHISSANLIQGMESLDDFSRSTRSNLGISSLPDSALTSKTRLQSSSQISKV